MLSIFGAASVSFSNMKDGTHYVKSQLYGPAVELHSNLTYKKKKMKDDFEATAMLHYK